MFFYLLSAYRHRLRRDYLGALLLTVVALSACVSTVPVGEPQASHPANPEAQAAPLLPDSKTLAIDPESVPKPAPKPAAGGHDHHKHH